MKRRNILFLVMLCFSLGGLHTADARIEYLDIFNETYGTAATSLNSCSLCHPAVPALNAYGADFQSAGNDPAAIGLIDSDNDGFSNIGEINARTSPGDGVSSPAGAAMPGPLSGQQIIPRLPAPASPVVSPDPAGASPLGFGSVVQGGDTLTVHINVAGFAVPVDMYAAFTASTNPDVLININGDGQFAPLSLGQVLQALAAGQPPAGVTPLMSSISTPLNTTLFANIPAGILDPGKYTVFLLATPAGSISSFYLWQTEFTIGVPIMVNLNGAQEVPAVNTTASGVAHLAVNFDTGALAGTVLFNGLSSAANGAHIHEAAAGSNGPIIVPLTVPAATSGIITLSATLTPEQMTDLMNDQLYINIHTQTSPGGEIRGQIILPEIAIITSLSGAQEVPPVNTSGTGVANISVDVVTGGVNGTLTFSGLTSATTAAHFHQAAAGTNGPVIIGLTPPGAVSGVINISAMLTPEALAALAANELYFNVHTGTNPGGEIRGQIFYPTGAPLP